MAGSHDEAWRDRNTPAACAAYQLLLLRSARQDSTVPCCSWRACWMPTAMSVSELHRGGHVRACVCVTCNRRLLPGGWLAPTIGKTAGWVAEDGREALNELPGEQRSSCSCNCSCRHCPSVCLTDPSSHLPFNVTDESFLVGLGWWDGMLSLWFRLLVVRWDVLVVSVHWHTTYIAAVVCAGLPWDGHTGLHGQVSENLAARSPDSRHMCYGCATTAHPSPGDVAPLQRPVNDACGVQVGSCAGDQIGLQWAALGQP